MNITQLIYNKIVATVGPDVNGRINMGVLVPNSALPAIIYREVYGGHVSAISGNEKGFFRSRWQIDVIGTSFPALVAIRDKLEAAFFGMTDTTSSPRIYESRMDMEFSVYDDELHVYRYILDISILSDA